MGNYFKEMYFCLSLLEFNGIGINMYGSYVVFYVFMLRRFMDNYYIHVYKVPQLTCDQLWRDRFINKPDDFNSTTFPTTIFKHGMYYYTQLNTEFVRDNLLNVVVDNELVQLK